MLSTFPLIRAAAAQTGDDAARRALGGLLARLWTLRQASMAVAGALERGDGAARRRRWSRISAPVSSGRSSTSYEPTSRSSPIRTHPPRWPAPSPGRRAGPGFTLRGGTTEILRGIVARELGVR